MHDTTSPRHRSASPHLIRAVAVALLIPILLPFIRLCAQIPDRVSHSALTFADAASFLYFSATLFAVTGLFRGLRSFVIPLVVLPLLALAEHGRFLYLLSNAYTGSVADYCRHMCLHIALQVFALGGLLYILMRSRHPKPEA